MHKSPKGVKKMNPLHKVAHSLALGSGRASSLGPPLLTNPLYKRTLYHQQRTLATLVVQPLFSTNSSLPHAHPCCPIFSLQGRHYFSSDGISNLNSLPKSSWIQQRQLSNTTPGSYAPSKFAAGSNLSANRHEAGATGVFDESASEQLPSLPVPRLEDTLERLKETIWPIAMNSLEFAATLELIEKFSKSAGPKLDLLLRAKAGQLKNWLIHDWWIQEVYLKSREPLVINSNPSMFYPQFPYEINDQRQLINTIAQLISGIIEFKLALEGSYNPEATSPANEFQLDPNLCYSQYRNIFSTTRLPNEQMDGLTSNKTTKESPFTIVVSLRGQFYEISLASEANYDEQTRIDTLVSLLNKLFDQNSASSCPEQTESPIGPGLLTTTRRDQWAQTRQLLSDEALKSIERAQFVVSLDTIQSKSDEATPVRAEKFSQDLLNSPQGSSKHSEALSRQILHSDRFNVGNRWFDKSLQLIIVSDEQCQRYLGAGINYEHSTAEATVITKIIEYSYDRALANHNRHASKLTSANSVESSLNLIRFYGDDRYEQIEGLLKQAQVDFVAHIDQFDLAYFHHKAYGSNAIKSIGFSPDSWFQVALQLAYHQLHKRLGPCYESASTRRFAFGRTETIRSLTKDVAEFCHEPSYQTMQSAIKSHKSYAIAANNASAIDRVLMGYRLVFNELRSGSWNWGVPLFEKNDQKMPLSGTRVSPTSQTPQLDDLFTENEQETLSAFFNNELIERSKKFALSTSQVSSIHPNICMSFGPLLTDGYGCCYNITGQLIVASITANSENLSFSCEVDKLSESLHDSLHKMRSFVDNEKQRKG